MSATKMSVSQMPVSQMLVDKKTHNQIWNQPKNFRISEHAKIRVTRGRFPVWEPPIFSLCSRRFVAVDGQPRRLDVRQGGRRKLVGGRRNVGQKTFPAELPRQRRQRSRRRFRQPGENIFSSLPLCQNKLARLLLLALSVF